MAARSRALLVVWASGMLCPVTAAVAQPAPDLAGKQVSVVIGFGTGSGYDTWGRLVARSVGKFLPGKPNVIAQNMPGAGSFVAINNI